MKLHSIISSTAHRPVDLREAYSIYYRRRRLAVLIVLLTLIGVAVGDYLRYPVFESGTKILVERTAGAEIPFAQEQIAFRKSEITETQAQLLTSGPVLEQVVRQLGLASRPAPAGSPRDMVHAAWGSLLGRVGEAKESAKRLVVERVLGKTYRAPPEPDQFAMAMAGLREAVRAESIPSTDLVLLTVQDREPAMAAKIADAMAAAYLERELTAQRTKARHVYDLIDAQVQSFRPQYDAAQQAVVEFEQQHQARLLKDRLRGQLEQISRLEIAYREQASRMEITDREVDETHSGQVLNLRLELARLEQLYEAGHPKLIAARAELAKAEQAMAEKQATRPVTSAGNGSVLGNDTLARIKQAREEVGELTELEGQYSRLLETRDRNEKLYLELQSKREDAAVAEATRTPGPRIIEAAAVAGSPRLPRKRLDLVLGLIGGLFLAGALCALLEYLDRSIKSPADVARVDPDLEVWSIPDWRRPGALPRRLS